VYVFPAREGKNRRPAAGESGMNSLAAAFNKLSTKEKAIFLSLVAHEGTILARAAYAPTAAHPDQVLDRSDAITLRDAINFVHRVVGFIPHVLSGTEGKGQDQSVMEMIEYYFEMQGSTHLLIKWLKKAD
jgi:hypothetical protein